MSPEPQAEPGPPDARGGSGRGDPARWTERGLWLTLGAVLLVVLVAAGARLLGLDGASKGPPLPVLGSVPDFTLTERSGREVRANDLRGQIWVASFIFTRCRGICPVTTAGLVRLRKELGSAASEVRLVSFSVDPEHDRPEVLEEYARGYEAPDSWWFVTGERDALYRLIKEGFRLSVAQLEEGQAAADGELITHSDRYVLVDRNLRIRGYYHGTEAGAVAEVLADIRKLRRERGSRVAPAESR